MEIGLNFRIFSFVMIALKFPQDNCVHEKVIVVVWYSISSVDPIINVSVLLPQKNYCKTPVYLNYYYHKLRLTWVL